MKDGDKLVIWLALKKLQEAVERRNKLALLVEWALRSDDGRTNG